MIRDNESHGIFKFPSLLHHATENYAQIRSAHFSIIKAQSGQKEGENKNKKERRAAKELSALKIHIPTLPSSLKTRSDHIRNLIWRD